LSGLPVVVIVLGNELDPVRGSVAITNETPETDGLLGARKSEFDGNLIAHRKVEINADCKASQTQIRALAFARDDPGGTLGAHLDLHGNVDQEAGEASFGGEYGFRRGLVEKPLVGGGSLLNLRARPIECG